MESTQAASWIPNKSLALGMRETREGEKKAQVHYTGKVPSLTCSSMNQSEKSGITEMKIGFSS